MLAELKLDDGRHAGDQPDVRDAGRDPGPDEDIQHHDAVRRQQRRARPLLAGQRDGRRPDRCDRVSPERRLRRLQGQPPLHDRRRRRDPAGADPHGSRRRLRARRRRRWRGRHQRRGGNRRQRRHGGGHRRQRRNRGQRRHDRFRRNGRQRRNNGQRGHHRQRRPRRHDRFRRNDGHRRDGGLPGDHQLSNLQPRGDQRLPQRLRELGGDLAERPARRDRRQRLPRQDLELRRAQPDPDRHGVHGVQRLHGRRSRPTERGWRTPRH